MKFYAVHYNYAVEADQLNEVRPIHRAWLADRFAEGTLLASGPLVDLPGALLIFQAESPEALADLLDNDPFDVAGFIGERDIAEWNPVFGPWSEK